MKILKAIWSKLHIYVLWLIVSAVFWGWIFTLVTSAPAEKKVTLFIDAPACRDVELDEELEKTMPEGLKQVRAHLFSYVMFTENELLGSDLYVVPGSAAAGYIDSFRPLPAALAEGAEVWRHEGTAYGLPVGGAASAWVDYAPGETYYLFFGVNSVHIEDGKALAVAEDFLRLP